MSDEKKLPKRRFKEFLNTPSWEQRKLGEVAKVEMDKRIYKEQTTAEGEIPFYKIGTFGGKADSYISEELYNEYTQKYSHPKEGDILISASGSIGRTVVYHGEKAYFQDSNIVWLNHKGALDNGFLLQFYSRVQWAGLEGSTIKRLYNKNILETEINVPNIEEQKNIGKFFTQVDNLITLHQRKLNKLENLKKAYLEELFPDGKQCKPKRRFKEFKEDWEQRKLGQCSVIITGGTPSTRILEYWSPKEIPWMSSGEINKKRISKTDDKISKLGLEQSSARWVKKNSILIALAGQGKTRGTVAINGIDLTTNQSIAAIELDSVFNTEFVFQNLDSRYDELRKESSGDGTRGGLNKKIISDLYIPYTEYKEQDSIGDFFKKLDNLITLHQRKLNKLKNLKEAYLGELFV
ncbi:restriction endonuclease subunit S [Veillonella sp. 3913]|uniref:restriction endonuclease subunit S n=1 Tax=Veillonella sp. 3913 TaxID=2490952 RepID=UPI000F8D6B8D|nr:restriction endonuclease subunit S [Veillonella sp. 3913]